MQKKRKQVNVLWVDPSLELSCDSLPVSWVMVGKGHKATDCEQYPGAVGEETHSQLNILDGGGKFESTTSKGWETLTELLNYSVEETPEKGLPLLVPNSHLYNVA